jgi:hypothetical protein
LCPKTLKFRRLSSVPNITIKIVRSLSKTQISKILGNTREENIEEICVVPGFIPALGFL